MYSTVKSQINVGYYFSEKYQKAHFHLREQPNCAETV